MMDVWTMHLCQCQLIKITYIYVYVQNELLHDTENKHESLMLMDIEGQ